MLWQMLIFTVAISGVSSGAAGQEHRAFKIDVDGRTYRVRLSGNVAKANGTAFWTNPEDPSYFIRARRAIELVSGCRVQDSYTTANILIATLNCQTNAATH
jgi:hypothetical protein